MDTEVEMHKALVDMVDRGMDIGWHSDAMIGLDPTTTTAASDNVDEGFNTSIPESFAYELAMSCFRLGEYERCAYHLSSTNSLFSQLDHHHHWESDIRTSNIQFRCPMHESSKHVFLWAYSLFLAGERKKEIDIVESGFESSDDQGGAMNPYLSFLDEGLTSAFETNTDLSNDGFLLFIHGEVVRLLEKSHLNRAINRKAVKARDILSKAVCTIPMNWSAWLGLADCYLDLNISAKIAHAEVMKKLDRPDHPMASIFHAHLLLQHGRSREALGIYAQLHDSFPNSPYLLSQQAVAHYSARDYERAQLLFGDLVQKEPFRLQDMDIYSNILFVNDAKAELSHLAHHAIKLDRVSAETCCIIGNYYSMKNQHERSVEYFKRALRLNHLYLEAWTLMGHEYVELKSIPAAVEAYRSAVDINPRDHRAWYGLGHAYEMAKMPYIALYYYRQAASLQPFDASPWAGLASVNSKLGRAEDGIACFRRAKAVTTESAQ